MSTSIPPAISEWLKTINGWKQPPALKRKPIERWINAYRSGMWATHRTRELADRFSDSDRIECIHLVEASEAKEVWRLLEVGEVTQEGDQFYYPVTEDWDRSSVGLTVTEDMQPRRRRVRVIEVAE